MPKSDVAQPFDFKRQHDGYYFTVAGEQYKTDANGHGLWKYDREANWWNQVEGLLSFDLGANPVETIAKHFGVEAQSEPESGPTEPTKDTAT